MSPSRIDRCLAFLAKAEEVCREEDRLVARIAATDRLIASEGLAWLMFQAAMTSS